MLAEQPENGNANKYTIRGIDTFNLRVGLIWLVTPKPLIGSRNQAIKLYKFPLFEIRLSTHH